MEVVICANEEDLGQRAAQQGAKILREALDRQESVAIIVATGASQFETLAALITQPDIDWARVTAFHLDEYIGLPVTHPASFRKYLKERFVDQVPIGTFHYVNGEIPSGANDVSAELNRLEKLITAQPIEVAFVGIGENSHLAFNDPPADFDTESPYLIVDLDEDCRKQQLGEGWFSSFDKVPRQAISMSVQQILKSKHIICSVPDERKAEAVRKSVEGPVTNLAPSSILQEHHHTLLYLDPPSAGLLQKNA